MRQFCVLKGLSVLLLILGISLESDLYAAKGIIPGQGTQDEPYLIEDITDLYQFFQVDNRQKYWSSGVYTDLMTDIAVGENGSEAQDDINCSETYGVMVGKQTKDGDFIIIYDHECDLSLPRVVCQGAEYTDLSGAGNKTGYSGVFDGNNHLIADYANSDGSYCGLFGKINADGIVKNVSVVNYLYQNYQGITGLICGQNEGLIENCTAFGAITGRTAVGGICGLNKGVIVGCSYAGRVQAINDAGGIAGLNYGDIAECAVKAKVRAKSYAGGIAGINGDYENAVPGYISDSFVIGDVRASMQVMCMDEYGDVIEDCFMLCVWDNHYSGGIAALNVSGGIERCYASANTWYSQDIPLYSEVTALVGKTLEGALSVSFAESEIPADETKLNHEQMTTAATFIEAGWDCDNLWTVADGAYPVLATIRYAEGWDTLSVIPAVEQDDDQQVEYKYHKFRLETSSDIKTISYGGSTAISAKLYYDGELITDDYQVNWTNSRNSNNYYIEDGILYNINDDTFGDCLSLHAEVNFEGFTITNYLSLTLLSEVKPDTCVINKATVKASKNRDNPDDSISLSIRSIDYPTYVADDLERDKHITVEVYEENNTILPVITRTFPINENIVQYGLNRGLEVSSVKVINDAKDKNNYFKFNSNFARNQEADIRLSGLNLSGLKKSLTVKIYNSHFITVDTVTDKNEPYKSLAGDDKINGRQDIPVSLCMGVSDNIYLQKYRGRVSRGTKRNGFCNFSGTFSLVDVNSLAEKGLAFEFNDKTFYLTANEVHYFESTSVYYKFVSEKPLIVYKNGKYTFSFSCNANGVVEGKSKDALILTVKGVFDTKTGKYSLSIKDIQQDYSTDKGGLRYDIAPFEDGAITDIYNAHGYLSGGDGFIDDDATSL